MLTIKNVSVTFHHHRVRAVENGNLDIRKGEKAVIIGETGSGKSVLLLSILKLLPADAATDGEIRFDSKDLLTCDEAEMNTIRGKRIGYIPQGGGGSLNPLLKTGFQVAEPMMFHYKVPKQSALKKAVELMRRFAINGTEKYSQAYPHQFSGGMRQRAMIAMGMSADPELLLIDEPTKGLDIKNIQTVVDCLQNLDHRTLLCVTHDLRVAKNIADKVYVMYAAQFLESAQAEDFFNDPLHPYSKALLASLPENGLKAVMGFAPKHALHASIGCRFYGRCPKTKDKCLTPPPLVKKNKREVRCWLYTEE
jgi:peptide/nickel transport system ATP-binding protein